MKKIALIISALAFAACGRGESNSKTATAGGNDDDTLLTCQSIDPTFSPYYEVKVRPFDPTFPSSFLLEIDETEADAFPGPVTVHHQREASGRILDSGAGELTFEDGKLTIRKLSNGVLKGDMTFGDASDIELVCQLVAIIQPVAGVSN